VSDALYAVFLAGHSPGGAAAVGLALASASSGFWHIGSYELPGRARHVKVCWYAMRFEDPLKFGLFYNAVTKKGWTALLDQLVVYRVLRAADLWTTYILDEVNATKIGIRIGRNNDVGELICNRRFDVGEDDAPCVAR
jgi:hypothetical protein